MNRAAVRRPCKRPAFYVRWSRDDVESPRGPAHGRLVTTPLGLLIAPLAAMLRALLLLSLASPAHARPGAHLPVPAQFDALGLGTISLGDILDAGEPLVVVVADHLRLLDAVRAAQPGDAQLVIISLEAGETTAEAYQAHAAVMALVGARSPRQVLYLRGDQDSIEAVTDAIGRPGAVEVDRTGRITRRLD